MDVVIFDIGTSRIFLKLPECVHETLTEIRTKLGEPWQAFWVDPRVFLDITASGHFVCIFAPAFNRIFQISAVRPSSQDILGRTWSLDGKGVSSARVLFVLCTIS